MARPLLRKQIVAQTLCCAFRLNWRVSEDHLCRGSLFAEWTIAKTVTNTALMVAEKAHAVL